MSAAGQENLLPRHRVRFFNPRKSVVVEQLRLLMPGYLLARGIPHLRAYRVGDRVRLLDGCLVSDSIVTEFRERMERGEYDDRPADKPRVGIGARVRVIALSWTGRVTKRVGKRFEVLLDGIRKTVLVATAGLELRGS